jgi:hypothetical protein
MPSLSRDSRIAMAARVVQEGQQVRWSKVQVLSMVKENDSHTVIA